MGIHWGLWNGASQHGEDVGGARASWRGVDVPFWKWGYLGASSSGDRKTSTNAEWVLMLTWYWGCLLVEWGRDGRGDVHAWRNGDIHWYGDLIILQVLILKSWIQETGNR